jgi:hypothetical protein
MENGISAPDQILHQLTLANVALDKADGPARRSGKQIIGPAAHHIVDHDDLAASSLCQKVYGVRSDESGSAGYHNLSTS